MKEENISFYSHNATHRIILLHGWGADAKDLLPVGEQLIQDIPANIELVSFNAPQDHPDGTGRQWYGLFPSDWNAVPRALEQLKKRIKMNSFNSIPLEKTFLFGFSQGGAMALSAGADFPLAGLICCSGYPHPNWEPPKNLPPILLTHGEDDQIVPIDACRAIEKNLDTNKAKYETYLFNGGHEIPLEVLNPIKKFISKNI